MHLRRCPGVWMPSAASPVRRSRSQDPPRRNAVDVPPVAADTAVCVAMGGSPLVAVRWSPLMASSSPHPSFVVSCSWGEPLRSDGGGAVASLVTAQEGSIEDREGTDRRLAAHGHVGTYRGAAATCDTTYETVRGIVQRHFVRRGAAGWTAGGAATSTRYRMWALSGSGSRRRRRGLGEAAARRPGPRGTRGRPQVPAAGHGGSSGVASRSAPGPPAGGVGPRKDAAHRLRRPGRAARVLRGVGVVAVPVRPLRRRETGSRP